MVGIKTCSIGSDCSCQGIVEWIRLLGRQQGFGSLDVTATYVRSLLPQQDDVDQAVLPVADAATPAQPTLFRGGKIFTIQPFSRKCPIGHALDIPFENWTSSLRIYNYYFCSFSNLLSVRDALNCTETGRLTGCPARVVSPSCPIFPPPHFDRTRWHVSQFRHGDDQIPSGGSFRAVPQQHSIFDLRVARGVRYRKGPVRWVPRQ